MSSVWAKWDLVAEAQMKFISLYKLKIFIIWPQNAVLSKNYLLKNLLVRNNLSLILTHLYFDLAWADKVVFLWPCLKNTSKQFLPTYFSWNIIMLNQNYC